MKLNGIKKFIAENKYLFILFCITATLLTFAAVIFKQSVFRVFPLYVSLVIGLLQSRANRYAPLLGGVNSIFYAMVNVYYGLYASAFYALLFSCPIQIMTFIRWNKNAYESSTVFKSMSLKLKLSVAVLFVVSWSGVVFLLGRTGGNYIFLDSFGTVLGILTTFLTFFAFKEYAASMLLGCFVSVALYISMMFDMLEQTTYLIYAVYTVICNVRGFFRVRTLYREQNAIMSKKN